MIKCNPRVLSLLLTGILSLSSFSQNPSFKIISDSIYPLIQSNEYDKAKQIWRATEKEFTVDQQEKYLFLLSALRNNDLKFFRKEMTSLMKESGYFLSVMDTSSNYGDNTVNLFREKGVLEWVVKKSNKYYPKWIVSNPIAHYAKQRSDFFIFRDQNFIRGIPPECDTSIHCKEKHQEYYTQFAMMSASDLATFFIEIGGVANNIDHGVDVYYPLLVVIHHILETSEESMEYAWTLLLPYFEKAYFDGKIGSDIFYIYDEALFQHTGYQYYGQYGEAPILDQEGFEGRVRKYNFKF